MLFGDDNDSDLVLLGLKCLVMKMGLVMLEYHDLETHLNRIMDFTGSWLRMLSNKMSSGRDCLDVRGAIGVI